LRYFLAIFCLLSLSGCVNYAGIHSHAQASDEAMLNSSYADEPVKKVSCHTGRWWTVFHDPQLNNYIETALASSPDLAVAQSRVRQAQSIAALAGSNLYPGIDSYGEITRERITRVGLFPPPYGGNTYTETNFGFNFNYEFDFWGKNRQTLNARLSEERAVEFDYAQSRLVLATAVASSYFQLQSVESQLRLAEDLQSQNQELLNIITVRAKHGVESDIPVSTANAEMQVTRITVAQLKESVKLSQHQLAALMGKNPMTTNITAAKFSYHQNLFVLPKIIPANLLARRPDLAAARLRVQMAAHDINAAKARFYPNINLVALLSLQSYTLNEAFGLPARDMAIGSAIDLPVFDAGARRAGLSQRYAEFDNAVGSYNSTILQGLREVSDDVSTLHSLDAQQRAQQDVLQATLLNYKLVKSRYAHGIVDYSNVLQQKNNLVAQQNQQIQLQAQHYKSMVAMIKALGGNYLRAEG
jgi:NodT family efflux transporter outer membrane factor (OMF) lipoprotein